MSSRFIAQFCRISAYQYKLLLDSISDSDESTFNKVNSKNNYRNYRRESKSRINNLT